MKIAAFAVALFPTSLGEVYTKEQAIEFNGAPINDTTGEATKETIQAAEIASGETTKKTIQAVEVAYSDTPAIQKVVDIGVLNVYEGDVTIYKNMGSDMVAPNTAHGVVVNSYVSGSHFSHIGGKSGKASGVCGLKYSECSFANDNCCEGYECQYSNPFQDDVCKYCGLEGDSCFGYDDGCCEGFECYDNGAAEYCVSTGSSKSAKSGSTKSSKSSSSCIRLGGDCRNNPDACCRGGNCLAGFICSLLPVE